jgi:hypothetical protein
MAASGTPSKMDLLTDPVANPAVRAAHHLLRLADALEASSHVRARMARAALLPPRPSGGRLDALRCWNPHLQGATLEVTCEPHPHEPTAGLVYLLRDPTDGNPNSWRFTVLGPCDRPEESAKTIADRLGTPAGT